MQVTQWLLIGVVVVPLVLVFRNRMRIDIAALCMAGLLGILQAAGLELLGPEHTPADAMRAISGFGQPVVITLISLFIVTRGIETSGAGRWLARRLVELTGGSETRLIVLFSGLTALLSLFMNNLTAGALALPSAMEAARRAGIRPSKLLIPVAYGSLLGGVATYFTTANIIMGDLLKIANPPQTPLGILDFTPAGGLIALTGLIFLWVLGGRLLPERVGTGQVAEDELDAPVDRRQAILSAGLTAAAVIVSMAGAPVYLAMLCAAGATLLLRVIPAREVFRAVEWRVIFLIAGMYAVSQALVQTGLAGLAGRTALALAVPLGPLGVAGGAYMLTAALTQLMGGQVTALVTGPVTISTAISLGINPHAVAVATAIGCSASFLTPMAHPVNVLMVEPGGYRPSDFLRVGVPLLLISFVMLLAGMKLFWGL